MTKYEFVRNYMIDAAIMCIQLGLDPKEELEECLETARWYAGDRDNQRVIEVRAEMQNAPIE